MSLRMMSLRLALVACLLVLAACGDDDVSVDAGPAPSDSGETSDAPANLTDSMVDSTIDSEGRGDAFTPSTSPNILLIIADDLGLDASAQYAVGTDLPNTPVLDALAAQGIVFDEAWATPACTTTRGTLITGLHGVHSGVDFVPAVLPDDIPTLHDRLAEYAPQYATAIVGKWHLGGRAPELDAPNNAGVGYYAGTIAGVIDDYYAWDLVLDGELIPQSTYHTTAMTDLAIDWIDAQDGPWFMWLAHVAPHIPFHLPPSTLQDRDLPGTSAHIRDNQRDYYLAAVEAMDREIGRLLGSLDAEERANTLIVFLGDNGTPAQAVDARVFDASHAKNSLYEGGVRIPMIVAGAGVERVGARESALVHTADLMPTLLDFVGAPDSSRTGIDGVSFAATLRAEDRGAREFNYTEFVSAAVTGWAVRDERYKLLVFANGTRELYDLSRDLAEQLNLIDDPSLLERIASLEAYGEAQRR